MNEKPVVWFEIAEDWLLCRKHAEQFEVSGICLACYEEEVIYAEEVKDDYRPVPQDS